MDTSFRIDEQVTTAEPPELGTHTESGCQKNYTWPGDWDLFDLSQIIIWDNFNNKKFINVKC